MSEKKWYALSEADQLRLGVMNNEIEGNVRAASAVHVKEYVAKMKEAGFSRDFIMRVLNRYHETLRLMALDIADGCYK